MTKEECKNLLVEKVNNLGGTKVDELVAWAGLYVIEGFSETFNPEMIKQLMYENRIGAVEYDLPNGKTSLFLFPKDSRVKLINLKIKDN